ncbi:hypothetical protein EGJ28_21350 [Stutzerimonas xanthomarina]|jgi:crotonobetainyl-CoA:carnitine CoA-transferase CaiB-like acyl-CoA transferase|uniref:Uncharacterized protein n=2 Tax=Pseudomonadaceae TaxID=135621 RepID=A0A427DPL4_9GAMM|nr:hypothetical protein EGJ28_21350 [Stutzerimonas xanthomarina]
MIRRPEDGRVLGLIIISEDAMSDLEEICAVYGGANGYRAVHEGLSRALAEPGAQGENAHGARAAFLLAEIAPHLMTVRRHAVLQFLEDAGVPLTLVRQVGAALHEPQLADDSTAIAAGF